MAKSLPGWLDAPWNPDQTQDAALRGDPEAWSSLIVNSERLPGMALVSVPRHVLVKQHGRASGKTPGAPTVRGREPGTAQVSLVLRNNREWADYVAIAPRLLPWVKKGSAGNRTSGAVQVYHPLLPAQGYSDFAFDWVLMFAKAMSIPPFRRIKFTNFFVLGDRGSWSQGTQPLTVRIPCHVGAIERDLGDGIFRCPINIVAELGGI